MRESNFSFMVCIARKYNIVTYSAEEPWLLFDQRNLFSYFGSANAKFQDWNF